MSFRKENKYRVTRAEYHKMKSALASNGMKLLYKPRKVISAYFDSIDLQMYCDSEEGVLPRKKVRIRWYSNNKGFTLEKKTSSEEGRFKTTRKMDNINCIDTALQFKLMDQQYGILFPSSITKNAISFLKTTTASTK